MPAEHHLAQEIGFFEVCPPTRADLSTCSDSKFSRMIWHAFLDWSTKYTYAAPRLSASMPMPPIPAHPSRNVAPGTRSPRISNTVSLSLSLVVRIPPGGVALRRRLLNRPEMTRIRDG